MTATKYRISKRPPVRRTVHVRLAGEATFRAVSYEDGTRVEDAVRARARQCAPEWLRTARATPTLFSVWRDGREKGTRVEHGGPGMAVELMTEQLFRSAETRP